MRTRVQTKQRSLFADGYRLGLHSHLPALWVVRPDGSQYLLFPYEARCTCPGHSYRGECKHKREWKQLLFSTAEEFARFGELVAAEELVHFYFTYLAAQGQRQ